MSKKKQLSRISNGRLSDGLQDVLQGKIDEAKRKRADRLDAAQEAHSHAMVEARNARDEALRLVRERCERVISEAQAELAAHQEIADQDFKAHIGPLDRAFRDERKRASREYDLAVKDARRFHEKLLRSTSPTMIVWVPK